MELTKEDIVKYVDSIEKQLFEADKIKFNFDKEWCSNFPSKAGVYTIFDKDKLLYIGETANLKERMKEVNRTVNHSFRRKLGKLLVKNAKITKGKFQEKLEQQLNRYYEERLYFTFKEINLGRLEIEGYLIQRHAKNGLLNSIGKRNRMD